MKQDKEYWAIGKLGRELLTCQAIELSRLARDTAGPRNDTAERKGHFDM